MPMHRQHLLKLQQRNRQMQLPHRRHSSRKYSVNMHRHRLHIRMKPFLRIENQLNTLNNEMNQAQSDYNQAENSYQMAFSGVVCRTE